MIGDLLGYPREMWELLRHWSEQTMTLGGLNMTDGPPYVSHPDVIPVMVDFFTQTAELVEARGSEPRDDLISIWVAQGWEPMHVMEETLLLLDGGAETTRTVIGSMIRELALQPEPRRLLVERPELLSSTAVEEFIRWVSPILNMRRTVTEEHELHGQTLREGDQVVLMYAAANRDPALHRPRPARRDPARQPARRVRLRHALLPRRLARPARAPGDVRGAAAPHPRVGAGRPRRAADRPRHLRPGLRPHPHPVLRGTTMQMPMQVPVAEGVFTWPSDDPQLIGGRCGDCGLITFPIQDSCPRCASMSMEEALLARRGTLWAWTTQAFPPPPPYSGPNGKDFVPFGVGYVELPGEVKVETRLTESDPDVLVNGMDMELVIVPFRTDDDGNEVVTFAFRPVATGGQS